MTEVVSRGATPGKDVLAVRSRRWGAWYMAEHQLRVFRSYAWSMLVTAVGQPLLYLVALGIGLGALVGAGVGTVDGVRYIEFVAPALLVSTIAVSVGGEMTYPIMAGFQWEKTYYGPDATSLTPRQIAWGHFAAVMIRFVAQATIFWLMMLLFGAAPSGGSFLLIGVGSLTAAAIGAPLQAYAATLSGDGVQFSIIQRFVLMPWFLFSGTFFPLSVMPGWLQWIGWLSPVWHGTQLGRIVSYGASEPLWLSVTHLLVLVALAITGLWWSGHQYTRRLRS